MTCPVCGKHHITLRNGIEVGNIFQLGTKYSKSMNMTYTAKDGSQQTPIMGCYGIGVGRLLASVIEESSDDYGPIWPMSIAPWQIHIHAIRKSDEQVNALSEEMYDKLQKAGFEVLFDDRDMSAGVQFADADLLGTPIKVVFSPRNLKEGKVEVKTRDKSVAEMVDVENVFEYVSALVAKMKAAEFENL